MNMKRREDIKNSGWGCECEADTNVFLIPPNPRDDLHSAPAWVIDINGVYPHHPLPLPAHIIQFQIHNTAAPLTSTFLHQTNQQQHNEFIHLLFVCFHFCMQYFNFTTIRIRIVLKFLRQPGNSDSVKWQGVCLFLRAGAEQDNQGGGRGMTHFSATLCHLPF